MTHEEAAERLAYSVQEVARLLGVSDSTVKRLLASGQLKAVRVGQFRRIPRSELYRILDMNAVLEEAASR